MKINDYKRGLTTDEYAKVLNDCIDKVEGLNDLDWDEIVTKHNLGIHRDVLRKAFQSPMGGYSVYKYLQEEQINNVEKGINERAEIRMKYSDNMTQYSAVTYTIMDKLSGRVKLKNIKGKGASSCIVVPQLAVRGDN